MKIWANMLDCRQCVNMVTFYTFTGLLHLTALVGAWQMNFNPRSTVSLFEIENAGVASFPSDTSSEGYYDWFKLFISDDNSVVIGGKNQFYNLSLPLLHVNGREQWPAEENKKAACLIRGKTQKECQNYIRVMLQKTQDELFVCGTYACSPSCKTYRIQQTLDGGINYRQIGSLSNAKGVAPYLPQSNSTALYAGGKIYTATELHFDGNEPVIYNGDIRVQRNSMMLNVPTHFVSSMEYEDKIYFFFSEPAVEYINCGKAIFSRVARVCKNDQGGKILLKKEFTTFFKTRLNCSIPGDYPFYFDEIQATSDMHKGNYMSSSDQSNATDMIYAVFNTPQNSIQGSAICAFRFSDIIHAFRGTFKEQKGKDYNWQSAPLDSIPSPHPAECANSSTVIDDMTLNFVQEHPMMESAVPAFGGQPVVMATSLTSTFTQMAVDWQRRAGDGRYYDIMFIGRSDGYVLKTINKGRGSAIETVTIEEIEVFRNKPFTSMKIFRNPNGEEKLIVVSAHQVKTIPLHRCHLQKTCSACVALQDPYCSWAEGKCENSINGIQNIYQGVNSSCPADPSTTKESTRVTTPAPAVTCAPCICPQPTVGGSQTSPLNNNNGKTVVTSTASSSPVDGAGDKKKDQDIKNSSAEALPNGKACFLWNSFSQWRLALL
ncbi:semaphorin-1A isoform X1 [Lingula anatina]|uniref:Semaphorin-1A isoform X1 n=1 Tax=Lingula anatina TaxID=7574 RepID=A0A1S3JVI1_LINAN|nr:semaphorin-1A isoform X1 [Lingula anatina]XP_013414411.1 semaphorin-1A isoform X1 [Lingula anatina]XP_013414412.1 semaphorin-1A isoform X1 [Lingula anatina]XP_013414413.1 semaphorin-1A isoform X1 [Lingula anatina]XP_013414414.1 semaphorin-1A isoform X1 [Lingula anatina]XP_013414415.1 semaphorin-1A isoform X1 [Lingula anatina]|eukprot:XP_013414410.1 semaphorin-1A isoform X1 [Lingula anatina]